MLKNKLKYQVFLIYKTVVFSYLDYTIYHLLQNVVNPIFNWIQIKTTYPELIFLPTKNKICVDNLFLVNLRKCGI